MSNIRTRAGTGVKLTYQQMDERIADHVVNITGNASLDNTYNRTLIEYTGTGGHTVTLPDASTLLSSLDSTTTSGLKIGWYCRIYNNSNYLLSLNNTGTDQINGVNQDLTVYPRQTVVVQLDYNATGYTVEVPAVNENHFINGGFDIWQRGTSDATPTTTSDFYLADRWYVNSSGASLDQVERTSSVRTGAKSRYALLLTGAASVTTVRVGQRIESANVRKLSGVVTFSGWVYNGSGSAFTPQIIINTADVADVFSAVTNRLSATNLQSCADATWSYISYSVDISGYTDLTNGFEVQIQIPSGSLVASDTVRLAELKLERGAIATEFTSAGTSIAEELALCQRYYEKSYETNTDPTTTTQLGMSYFYVNGLTSAVHSAGTNVRFCSAKRATPSITLYSPSTGATGNVRDYTSTAADVAGSVSSEGVSGFLWTATTSASKGGAHFGVHWTADAEL